MKTTTSTRKSKKQHHPVMGNPVSPTFKKDLHIFDDEKLISRCTHIDRDTTSFAVHESKNMEGYVECDICGTVFNPDIVNKEYVKDAVDRMLNIMETIKMINIDMDVDDDDYVSFLNIIPYIKRVPCIYEKANESFKCYFNMDIMKPIMGPYGTTIPTFMPIGESPLPITPMRVEGNPLLDPLTLNLPCMDNGMPRPKRTTPPSKKEKSDSAKK